MGFRPWIGVGFALSFSLLVGCGGDDGSGGEGDMTAAECVPGTSFSCQGRSGCSGRQFCRGDGTLSACNCDDLSSGGGAGSGSVMDPDAGTDAGADSDTATDAATDSGTDSDAATDSGTATDAATDADAAMDGGSEPVDEVCDNGEDDDGDGDVDCADSDCGALRCVAPAPDGWSGPLALSVDADAPAACAGGFSDELLSAGRVIEAPPASCSECSCDGGGCATDLEVTTSADSACGGDRCTMALSASCAALTTDCLQGITTGYLETGLPGSLPACTPSGQAPAVADAAFAELARGCAPASPAARGCDNGETCMPAAAPEGFFETLCIFRGGDVACPSEGPYTQRQLYFTGIDDTRDCSACTCGDTDCDYTWHLYDSSDTLCEALPSLTVGAAGQCRPVSPSAGTIRVGVEVSGDGGCTPGGGQPTGGASGTGARTVCCEAP